jgi:ribosomal protein S18 acetylase RimI-like enzyme
MMTPHRLAEVMEATWPPRHRHRLGPWTIRDGAGGGKRVSAASAEAAVTASDLPGAEAAMRDLGQRPLFLIRQREAALDALLHRRGYAVIDPVLAYAAPVSRFAPAPVMTSFPHWPPMEIARSLWAEAGIGPARLAVMERVSGPKTAILARARDRAAGVAFVALDRDIAMLHALEITPDQRRQGCAGHLLRAAAVWAAAEGADTISLVVTEANAPARALYVSAGMVVAGQYHYREAPQTKAPGP